MNATRILASWLTAVCLICELAGLASAQTTIYSDDFNGGGGPLNGSAEDTQGAIWSANSAFLNNGTIDLPNEGSALLSFNPVINATYELSMSVNNASTQWIALGFARDPLTTPGGSSLDDRFSNEAEGIAWMLYRDAANNVQDTELFGGLRAAAQIADTDPAINFAQTNALKIILNTMGDGSNFTANFLLDQGGGFTSISSGPQVVNVAVSDLNFVGLSYDNTAATAVSFDNFLLTQLITGPAPNEWNVNGGGNFGAAGNWTLGTPTVGSMVRFGTILTAPNSPAVINMNVPASLDTVIIENAAGTYSIAGASTLTLTGNARVAAISGSHEIGAVIAGSAGLTKTGVGQLALSANNTYTGTTNVQAGILRLLNVGAVDGAANVSAGATLFFEGDGLGTGYSGTFAGDISGAGTVALSPTLTTETVTFSGAKTYTGQTIINNGTLAISHGSALGGVDGTTASGTLVDGNEATGKLALSGNIAVGDELLTIEARELTALNAVHLTSSGNNSWAGNFKGELGGSQYNIESTAGTLTLSGALSAPDTATRNFVFSGAGNTSVTGRIIDSATNAAGDPNSTPVNALNNVNVIKRGAGTLTIGTASTDVNNYWRGATTVEQGTLQVLSDGANGGELRSATISVAAGATLDVDHFGNYSIQSAQDLSGGGDIHAQTVSIFGDSLLSPGDNGIGTLTLRGAGGAGNANLYVGSDFFDAPGARGGLAYQLASATTIGGGVNDLVTGVQNLTFDVTQYTDTFVPLGTDSPIEVLLTLTESKLANGAPGTYRLINYTGTLSNVANTSVTFAPQLQGVGQTRQSFSVSTATAGQVNLVVTGSAGNQTWTGSINDDWNINSTGNWSGASSVYFDLDNVTFSDSAGANDTVEIVANVAPGSVTVTSATSNTYNFTGAGGITGNSDLALTGNVTAVLGNNGTNSFDDVSVVLGTVLQQGNGTSAGTTNIVGEVSGHGAVRVNSGTLNLSGNNSYTGVTTVNGGTLLMQSVNALGSVAGNTVINTGGTLRTNGTTFTINEPLSLGGGTFAVGGADAAAVTVASTTTVGASGGAFQVDGGTGADGLAVTGNIVGSSAGAFTANVGAGSTMTVSSNITNNGALNKTGTGILALTGTATVTSPTINVADGTLDLTGLNSPLVLASGQTLNNDSNNTVLGNVTAGSGGVVSGIGTFANNVTAQSGATVRVGAVGLPSVSVPLVIDNFNDTSLTDYTFTKILDQGATTNTQFSSPAGLLTSTSVGADGAEQVLFLRNDGANLDVGEELLVDAAITQANGNDLGIAVGATPTAGQRANYVFVSFRGPTQLNSRGFNGTTELPQVQAFGVTADQLFIARTATDTFEVGYYTGDVRTIMTTLTGMNTTIGNNIGFYSDLRANGVGYNGLDNLAIDGPSNPTIVGSATMTVQGDLMLNGGSILEMDIFDPSTLDSLSVGGNFAAAGALNVSLNAGAPDPQLGDVFALFDFGSSSGTFNSFTLPSLDPGLAWSVGDLLTTGELEVVDDVDLDNDGDVDGIDFLIIQRTNPSLIPAWDTLYGSQLFTPLVAASTAVPEPASALLVFAALCGARGRRLRRSPRD